MHGNLIVGVANQGTKSASGVQVSAYFDRDNSGTYTADQDDLIASSTLSTPLEVGESETISIAVNTKALFKDNPISVWWIVLMWLLRVMKRITMPLQGA